MKKAMLLFVVLLIFVSYDIGHPFSMTIDNNTNHWIKAKCDYVDVGIWNQIISWFSGAKTTSLEAGANQNASKSISNAYADACRVYFLSNLDNAWHGINPIEGYTNAMAYKGPMPDDPTSGGSISVVEMCGSKAQYLFTLEYKQIPPTGSGSFRAIMQNMQSQGGC
jgi:hypothetical protein